MMDPLTAVDDLLRLYQIQKLGDFFERGITEQNLERLVEELARQSQSSKLRP